MNIQQLLVLAPWTLKSIHTHLGWKQTCDVKYCHQKSRSRFEVLSQSHQITRNVCSYCASRLTGINISKFAVVETYIDNIKPHFKNLRNLTGLQSVNDPQRPDFISKFCMVIGDQRINISIFKNGRCMLIINSKPIPPSLRKSFKGKNEVAEFAVQYVNNQYITKIFNYIIYGQHFVMP